MINPKVTDISNREDGIKWNPKYISEKITGVSFDKNDILDDELWGPENIYTVYYAAFKNVQLDELINYDGSLNNDVLDKARQEYHEFNKEMLKGGYNEEKFTNYVKDK